MIRIKRTYQPAERGDGQRLLVERLWPRGMKKEALEADAWLKEVAPSTELRQWFAHRVDRWEEFRRRYGRELRANRAAWEPILDASRRGTVTLLYSAHDTLHNGAVVLRDFLVDIGRAIAPKIANKESKPMVTARHPARKPSKNDAAKREIIRRPHKDDFHEQREHDQEQTAVLRRKRRSKS